MAVVTNSVLSAGQIIIGLFSGAFSLVVAVGIGGSLAGYRFLEPLAAALVGFLILHMSVRLAWKAVRELIGKPSAVSLDRVLRPPCTMIVHICNIKHQYGA